MSDFEGEVSDFPFYAHARLAGFPSAPRDPQQPQIEQQFLDLVVFLVS
jgi:hypothetical protein